MGEKGGEMEKGCEETEQSNQEKGGVGREQGEASPKPSKRSS